MKVGTDGVLLGAWCQAEGADRVLDIGTGSGVIALMLAQRNPRCIVDALETDHPSCIQAAGNAACCPWKSRITIHHISFQDFYSQTRNTYDLIVTNPPYFQNSYPSPSAGRSAARHASSLSMHDLISGVCALLNPGGRYSMIMPVPEAMKFIATAGESGLHCKRITSVLPNPGKPPKRLLLEFGLTEGGLIRSELVVELAGRHEYSADFKSLTEDFYLAFRY
jgi:tRNA1Val (adenine37-N6)-methyltransferase